MKVSDLKVQYVTNNDGRKTGVLLSVEDFEELLEELEDLAVLAERREDPLIPHEEVVARLKRDGLLPD